MKKLRFAIQVMVLVAAFPILFIVGISHNESKANDSNKKEEPVTIQKTTVLEYPGMGVTGVIKFCNTI